MCGRVSRRHFLELRPLPQELFKAKDLAEVKGQPPESLETSMPRECSEFGDHWRPPHHSLASQFQNMSDITSDISRTSISSISDLFSLDQGREKAPKAPEPKAAGYNGRAAGAESSRAQILYDPWVKSRCKALTQRICCARRGSSCLWLSRPQRHLAFQHPYPALEFTRIH